MQKHDIQSALQPNLVALEAVWSYQPSLSDTSWSGSYHAIQSGEQSYVRPQRDEVSFELTLRKDNPLGLTRQSIGIYVIYDRERCLYVGKTDTKIEQRFHAHVTKLTATNNKRHHHPKKWQDYARKRWEADRSSLNRLDGFKLGFYDLSDFLKFLDQGTNQAMVNEMEALVYFGLKDLNGNAPLLNTEGQVGHRVAREKWQHVFA